MRIEIRLAYNDAENVRELFDEYTKMLVENDSGFSKYLDIQGYADELADLEGKYGLPTGRLYIAYANGQPAGCIALRPLGQKRCEMKRLYVRPRYRGKKIGKALVDTVINDAIRIGYDCMMLDTLPTLEKAISMYLKHGFYEAPPYNDSPVEKTAFYRLDLDEAICSHPGANNL